MANNFVQDGDVLDWTNDTGFDVSSGDVVVIGSNGDALLTIAQHDIANGQTGSVAAGGVWEVPKADAAVIAFGESVLWDASAGNFDDNQAVAAAGDVADGAFAIESKGATTGETIKVKLAGIPGVLT